ncbi:MAG TPA: hypothetical protein VGB82_15700 [Alphaproteobacteria bacterium]
MGAGLEFWLGVAAKMAVTVAFVILATRAAERAGPLIGAMVATLPVAAGPAYVFLSLEHDSSFIATTALSSLAVNAATVVFCLVHARVAQSRGMPTSLAATLGAWGVLAVAIRSVSWTLPGAVLLNVCAIAVCLPLARRFRHIEMPAVARRWYDVPLRAGMVATLVATVVSISSRVGPTVTGILAIFPIVLTSLVLIFQPRIGGKATAAIIANGIIGLAGFSLALAVLHVTAVPLGSPAALCLSLLVSLGWNISVVMLRRRQARRA